MLELGKRTTQFLYDYLFSKGDVSEEEKQYRYEHTLRVTHIGLDLARKEGANEKVVLLACLLHDLAKFDTEINRDHGRESARIARPFLETLNLTKEDINDICFAIAIHVDGKAGYEYPAIIEGEIVSDADNIDRFAAYRIHEMMTHTLALKDKIKMQETVMKRIEQLKIYKEKQILGTKSGNEKFDRNLDLAIQYFSNFLNQLNDTNADFKL